MPAGYVPHHVVGDLRQKLREREDAIKAWGELGGDPKAVKAEIERLRKLSEGKNFTPDEAKTMAAQLAEVDPEYVEMKRTWKAERQARADATVAAGETKAKGWMKELGLQEGNPKAYRLIQELVAGAIADDEAWFKRLKFSHDATVYDEAFALVKKTFGLGALKRQQDADVLRKKQTALARPAAAAAPAGKEPAAPQTDREKMRGTHEQAHEMLAAMGAFEE